MWWILGIALLSTLPNYFLGEELLFRGVLEDKQTIWPLGLAGEWSALRQYHLHKLWMLIIGSLAFAWPASRFRSMWMAIIVHGVEWIYMNVSKWQRFLMRARVNRLLPVPSGSSRIFAASW